MKNDIVNIPKGYKNSPLGIIPKEWEVRRLIDVCYNQGDYGVNAPAVPYEKDLPTYLRITDINDEGKFIRTNRVSVNITNSVKYSLKEGDIVFARTGATVGKTYLYNTADGDLVFAGFLIRFTPNTEKIFPYYIRIYADTTTYWNWVRIISQRSGQPGINAAEYCSLKIPVPSLTEQQKIIEVLSTWDKAIEKQSQLIEKLELRKKGLMQQLLTGKKRLSGFSGEWKNIKLGDIVSFFNSNTLSREKLSFSEGNILNIHYGDVLIKFPTILDVSVCNLPFIHDIKNFIPKDYISDGDVIMADTAEDGTVGKVCEVINVGSNKIVAGLHTIFIHPKIKFSPMFLGYYLNSNEYHKQILSIMQGIKVYSITKEALRKTYIKIPCIEEQKAIADILSSCDKELNLTNNRLESLRKQKKGLMQVLLTGKKRLIK